MTWVIYGTQSLQPVDGATFPIARSKKKINGIDVVASEESVLNEAIENKTYFYYDKDHQQLRVIPSADTHYYIESGLISINDPFKFVYVPFNANDETTGDMLTSSRKGIRSGFDRYKYNYRGTNKCFCDGEDDWSVRYDRPFRLAGGSNAGYNHDKRGEDDRYAGIKGYDDDVKYFGDNPYVDKTTSIEMASDAKSSCWANDLLSYNERSRIIYEYSGTWRNYNVTTTRCDGFPIYVDLGAVPRLRNECLTFLDLKAIKDGTKKFTSVTIGDKEFYATDITIFHKEMNADLSEVGRYDIIVQSNHSYWKELGTADKDVTSYDYKNVYQDWKKSGKSIIDSMMNDKDDYAAINFFGASTNVYSILNNKASSGIYVEPQPYNFKLPTSFNMNTRFTNATLSNIEMNEEYVIYTNQYPDYYSLLDANSSSPFFNYFKQFIGSDLISSEWKDVAADNGTVIVNIPKITDAQYYNYKTFLILQFNKVCHMLLIGDYNAAKESLIAMFTPGTTTEKIDDKVESTAPYIESIATLFLPSVFDVLQTMASVTEKYTSYTSRLCWVWNPKNNYNYDMSNVSCSINDDMAKDSINNFPSNGTVIVEGAKVGTTEYGKITYSNGGSVGDKTITFQYINDSRRTDCMRYYRNKLTYRENVKLDNFEGMIIKCNELKIGGTAKNGFKEYAGAAYIGSYIYGIKYLSSVVDKGSGLWNYINNGSTTFHKKGTFAAPLETTTDVVTLLTYINKYWKCFNDSKFINVVENLILTVADISKTHPSTSPNNSDSTATYKKYSYCPTDPIDIDKFVELTANFQFYIDGANNATTSYDYKKWLYYDDNTMWRPMIKQDIIDMIDDYNINIYNNYVECKSSEFIDSILQLVISSYSKSSCTASESDKLILTTTFGTITYYPAVKLDASDQATFPGMKVQEDVAKYFKANGGTEDEWNAFNYVVDKYKSIKDGTGYVGESDINVQNIISGEGTNSIYYCGRVAKYVKFYTDTATTKVAYQDTITDASRLMFKQLQSSNSSITKFGIPIDTALKPITADSVSDICFGDYPNITISTTYKSLKSNGVTLATRNACNPEIKKETKHATIKMTITTTLKSTPSSPVNYFYS